VNNVTFLPWVEPPEAEPTAGTDADVSVVAERPVSQNARVEIPFVERPVVELPASDAHAEDLADDDLTADGSSPDVETALLRALTRRDMSEREVRTWLAGRDVPENDVEQWVERMQRLGYVDDLRMATHLVDKLVARGGKGRQVIVQKLGERGIDRSTAAEAVSHLDEDSEQAQATELAVARASRMGSLPAEAARRRLHGFLARRGYSSAVIREALQHALSKPG